MFCVLRVSMNNCSPSLSSIRESRHQGGCCLPLTRALKTIPCSFHPSRTSANGFFSANSAKHGKRNRSSSLMPPAVHFSAAYKHGAAKRNNIGGEIRLSDISTNTEKRRAGGVSLPVLLQATLSPPRPILPDSCNPECQQRRF